MGDIRLVPEGCDYLLRGVAEDVVDDGEWLHVRATAPGGTTVVALIAPAAAGLTVLDDGTLSLAGVAVPAARVRPA